MRRTPKSPSHAVFVSRFEVSLHKRVQVAFVGVPAPRSTGSQGNVRERVEIKLRQLLMSCSMSAIDQITVPEMTHMSEYVTDFTTYSIEEGPGPGTVMLRSPSIHFSRQCETIELSERRAQNCPIPPSHNTGIVQAMLLEHVPATRPGKAICGSPRQQTTGYGNFFLGGLFSNDPVQRCLDFVGWLARP